jgi:FAD/FMN-containing dehydrogenase
MVKVSDADFASFAKQAADVIGASHVVSGVDMAPFESDFWKQYSGKAALVVRPGTTAEVAQLVSLAAHFGIAIVPQGGNTGLVNGGIPDGSGQEVVLSLQRLNRIRAIDAAGDYITVEAGIILADVQKAAEGVDRLFPLALGAEGSCRIGGNIATNAGGVNVLRYGMTRDLVLGLEVVLPDGQLLNLLKPLRKDNTGYDLKQLFIGSEGTLGIVTAATLRLVAPARERVTLWLTVHRTEDAVSLFRHLRGVFGDLISSFELISSYGVEAACTHLPSVRRPVDRVYPWHVLIEIAWTFTDGLRERAEAAIATLFEEGRVLDGMIAENETQRQMMWRIREGQSEATSKIGYVVRSDVTVAIADIPALVARCEAWTPDYGADVALLPFGHIGDGNLHMNFVVPREKAGQLSPLLFERLFAEVDALNGSISAEHGVGRAKRDAIIARKPETAMALMRHLKAMMDPQSTLNPGVVVSLDPPDLSLIP